MPIEIPMPALSPTMKEGRIAKWHKQEGEAVKSGDLLAEIETDKAVMEMEAIDSGVLGKILITEGTSGVKVNQILAILLEEGEDSSVLSNMHSTPSTSLSKDIPKPEISTPPTKLKESIDKSSPKINQPSDRIFVTPLARRLAEQNNLALHTIDGSGPHGRIIKEDILTTLQYRSSTKIYGEEKKEANSVPNSPMRKAIAQRLTESKQQTPHFYLDIECVMDSLLELRQTINAQAEGNVKISVNDLIIKAVALAIKKEPKVNGSWQEEAIIYYGDIDVSVAVALEDGLITPIIKQADAKSLSLISSEMKELATKARNGALKPHEFQGGGFTISNLGMFEIDNFKAIINPPQSCILAVGKTKLQPIVKEGAIIAAHIARFSLSCDHRVVDGVLGAKFLAAFKTYIENPIMMLVQ